MPITLEDSARAEITRFLPDLIARALTSYYRFAGREVDNDSKEFAEYHKSCKVAIAHIELLIKLSKWADRPADTGEGEDAILSGMLEKAREELDAYKRQQPETEDDSE